MNTRKLEEPGSRADPDEVKSGRQAASYQAVCSKIYSQAPVGSGFQGKAIKRRWSLEMLVSANFAHQLLGAHFVFFITITQSSWVTNPLLLSSLMMLFLEGGLTRDASLCLIVGLQPTPFPIRLLSRHLPPLPCSRVCTAQLLADNHHLLRLFSLPAPLHFGSYHLH